jgi:hypothetical protein
MCQPLSVEGSVCTCVPATLLCASAQTVTLMFTSYSCLLKISFRCVDVRGLRIYGTAQKSWAHYTRIIGHFIHMLLTSRHAVKFMCYYKILIISSFYSPYSKLSSPSVLLSHRTHPKSKYFFGFGVFPTQYTAHQQKRER